MKFQTSSLALIAPLILASCTYDPAFLPEFGITEVTYYPKYFCSGEQIWISWRGKRMKKVEIYKNDNSLLLRMLGKNSGSGRTPPMQAGWTPLKITGFSKYGKKGPESLSDKVINIDNQTWTEQYWSFEETSEPSVELVHVSSIQEVNNDGTIEDVKVYEVYRKFLGFTWNISAVDFSLRAGLVGIRNDGDQTLTFDSSGIAAQQLTPGAIGSITGFPRAAPRRINAKYSTPDRRLIGIQTDEDLKPPTEHYQYEDLYAEKEYPISLSVICPTVS